MGDSEISTTRPVVTRRRSFISDTLAALRRTVSQGADHLAALQQDLSLLEQWHAANQKTTSLCRKQQRLETLLIEIVSINARANVRQLSRSSSAPANPQDSNRRWAVADRIVGYTAAKQDEEAAAREEQKLAAALWAAPAQSIPGVCAKLAVMLEQGEWCEDCPEFPWPQLRAALSDLLHLGGMADVSAPGVKASTRGIRDGS